MKKKITLTSLFAIILLSIFCGRGFFQSIYISILKKSTVIHHFDSSGKYDGEQIAYWNGIRYFSAEFKNGLNDGWVKRYYTNGNLKNETFYRKGHRNGVEKEYYKSGTLNYIVYWKNDQNFGNEYHYSVNNNLINYDAFDITNGDIIFYAEYDSLKRITKQTGSVFSDNIYSKTIQKDSNIILENNKPYSKVKDLFITVATPPYLTCQIVLFVNNKIYKNLNVKTHTLVTPNVFSKNGNFKVSIIGKLLDDNGTVVLADTLNRVINIR